MISTETADCGLSLIKKDGVKTGAKTFQTAAQGVALALFVADGVLHGLNQEWVEMGENALQILNANGKLLLTFRP